MKFTVEVGQLEKHLVEYQFNQLFGSLLIQVDNKPVYRATRLFNEPVRETYHLKVGEAERATIRIEKQRKQLFGHRNCVYVDNRLARIYEGF
jgi:hypothetical protein